MNGQNQPAIPSHEVKRIGDALDAIATVLKGITQPTRVGTPNGDGLLKILDRIATALETIANK